MTPLPSTRDSGKTRQTPLLPDYRPESKTPPNRGEEGHFSDSRENTSQTAFALLYPTLLSLHGVLKRSSEPRSEPAFRETVPTPPQVVMQRDCSLHRSTEGLPAFGPVPDTDRLRTTVRCQISLVQPPTLNSLLRTHVTSLPLPHHSTVTPRDTTRGSPANTSEPPSPVSASPPSHGT